MEIPYNHPLLAALDNEADKATAWTLLRDTYPELLLDPDQHPVVIDQHGVLRFKTEPLLMAMYDAGCIDLNKAACYMTPAQQSKLNKSIGYSCAGFFELSSTSKYYGLDQEEEEEEQEPEEQEERGNKRGRDEEQVFA